MANKLHDTLAEEGFRISWSTPKGIPRLFGSIAQEYEQDVEHPFVIVPGDLVYDVEGVRDFVNGNALEDNDPKNHYIFYRKP